MAQYQNVSDLYTDVQKYVDTKEAYFISKIPAWVYFAETELDRRLRHPAAEKVDVFTVSAGYDYLTAPKNLLELKSIRNRSNNQILYRQSYEKIYDVQNYSNQPIAFASVSNMYKLDKAVSTDTAFEVVYYIAPEKLDVSNSSNLYLIAVPDFLLWVALEQAYIFDGQPDQAQYWRNMAETSLTGLQEQLLRESYQGSTLVTWANSDNITRYY
ncbi:hypothetical protein J2X14_000519 [Pantoea alhagi]|uniref:phage adaptor protein n=1 Tax=Mixta sp. BE291 TaxID=3158787 RepID=UPI002859C358|nr:hypothetical protein [Pantoea alhagi]